MLAFRLRTQRSGYILLAGLGLLLSGCSLWSSPPPARVFPYGGLPAGHAEALAGHAALAQESAELASVNPFDPIALNNLAVIESGRGRYQHALSLLQRAVKLAPARADIAVNLGNLQRWMAQAEGQAALGLAPQPLQLPYQETGLPDVPPLWRLPDGAAPSRSPAPDGRVTAPLLVPSSPPPRSPAR
jgi:hypothetical protein